MDRCTRCNSGPAGIEGHDDLFTFRMGGSQLLFKCRECNAAWIRTYKGEGSFDWKAGQDDTPGASVPGWHAR